MYVCIYIYICVCILAWKAALMDTWMPRAWMLRAMLRALAEAGKADKPFDHVYGPASAVVASVRRLD